MEPSPKEGLVHRLAVATAGAPHLGKDEGEGVEVGLGVKDGVAHSGGGPQPGAMQRIGPAVAGRHKQRPTELQQHLTLPELQALGRGLFFQLTTGRKPR